MPFTATRRQAIVAIVTHTSVAQAHGDHRAFLVKPAGDHMHTECREHERGRSGDGDCQPHGPALLHPQPGAGDDIGETRHKVEPQHERHVVAGRRDRRLVATQGHAAFLDGQQAEPDSDQR